jgi:hypothetical protein
MLPLFESGIASAMRAGSAMVWAMPIWQRIYITACSAVIGYMFGYALCVYGEWPKATYSPYDGSWQVLDLPPDPMMSNYVGIVLWGASGAAVAAAVVWIATGRFRRELPRRWLHLFGMWALSAFVLTGAFFTWNLWPF